jgi:hypothetical protein
MKYDAQTDEQLKNIKQLLDQLHTQVRDANEHTWEILHHTSIFEVVTNDMNSHWFKGL